MAGVSADFASRCRGDSVAASVSGWAVLHGVETIEDGVVQARSDLRSTLGDASDVSGMPGDDAQWAECVATRHVRTGGPLQLPQEKKPRWWVPSARSSRSAYFRECQASWSRNPT